MFTIKEIKDDKIDKFIKCPYEIYKGNSYWIPQLDRDVKNILSDKNLFGGMRKGLFFWHMTITKKLSAELPAL